MPDFHYHANHIDAPARGAKASALRDARRLRLSGNSDGWLVDPGAVTAETVKDHGVEFPLIVRCRRHCRIVPK